MDNYKKIIVIGCPGSGKSYFSIELAKILKIPLYHLDELYWMEGWVNRPKEEFRSIVNKIMENPEWIIDGNYGGTLEERFSKCELAYFLDLPTSVCLESEKNRRGNTRYGFPSFLEEKEDKEFIRFIENFPNEGRIKILSLIEKYDNVKVITFKSREEVNKYLENLKQSF